VGAISALELACGLCALEEAHPSAPVGSQLAAADPDPGLESQRAPRYFAHGSSYAAHRQARRMLPTILLAWFPPLPANSARQPIDQWAKASKVPAMPVNRRQKPAPHSADISIDRGGAPSRRSTGHMYTAGRDRKALTRPRRERLIDPLSGRGKARCGAKFDPSDTWDFRRLPRRGCFPRGYRALPFVGLNCSDSRVPIRSLWSY
jgi:hypothetical protein